MHKITIDQMRNAPEISRNSRDDMRVEVFEVPLSELKLTFMDRQGNPAEPGSGEQIMSYNFAIQAEGINDLLIKRTELVMDYSLNEEAIARVFVHVPKEQGK